MNVVHYMPEILTDTRREESINDCQPLLLTGQELSEKFGGKNYPGKQTCSDLHQDSRYKDILKIMMFNINKNLKQDLSIHKAWINWTDGDKQYECWHTHTSSGAKLSAVYYMTPHNCGTKFQDKFVQTELNSLLVFPSHLLHTAPVSDNKYSRYTMAFDLI